MLTASNDQTARIWNSDTGTSIRVLAGHTGPVNSAAYSPDGKQIVTASGDATARLWQVGTEDVKVFRGHDAAVSSAVFSPDGGLVLSASDDKTARLWDTFGFNVAILRGHDARLTGVSFSQDGAYILTGSVDNTARLWQTVAPPFTVLLSPQSDQVRAIRFSPDATRLLALSNGALRVLDVKSGNEAATIKSDGSDFTFATFSPDGTQALIASKDKAAQLWDFIAGKSIGTLSGRDEPIDSAEFSPDGDRVLTTSDDQPADLWNARTGTLIVHLAVTSAKMSDDGERIATTADVGAQLWDGRNGVLIATFEGQSPSFSADSKQVLTISDDNKVRLWNALSGAAEGALEGHEAHINSASFSPDGRRVLTVSQDKTARLWNTATAGSLTIIKVDGGVKYARFSPDGTRILASNGERSLLLDAQGALISEISSYRADPSYIQFSPDSRFLLIESDFGTPWLGDGKTGAELADFLQENGSVNLIDRDDSHLFSPDGALVAILGDTPKTSSVRIWQLPPTCQLLIDKSQAHLARGLSPSQRQQFFIRGDTQGRLMRLYTTLRPWMSWMLPTSGKYCADPSSQD